MALEKQSALFKLESVLFKNIFLKIIAWQCQKLTPLNPVLSLHPEFSKVPWGGDRDHVKVRKVCLK